MMNLASFVVLATAIAGASAQVMVNTPTSVVACLPVQLTWSGGQGPYFVSLLPGGKPSATPLEDFGQQSGNSYVWKADLPAGTQVTVQIRDSQGQLNYSDQFTIQPGSTTCATSSGSGSSGASSGTSTSSSPPATTTGTAAAGNTSASKTPTSTTTTTSTTNTTGSTPKTGATTGSTTSSTSPTTGANTGAAAGTSTNGTSASTDARSDASRTSAGVLAVAVSCVIAVFA